MSTIKKGKFEQPRTTAQRVSGRAAVKQPAKKKKKKSGGVVAVLVIVLLVAALAAGGWVYGSKLQKGNTIYPNVYVAGVNVGGMNWQEALDAVDQAVTATYAAETLEVHLPDRTLAFDPTQTNMALDAEEAVDKAMAFGREGNPFRAALDYARSRSGRCDIDLQTSMNLDTDYIRNLIDETAKAVARDAQSSAVDYDQGQGLLTIRVGTPAQRLDADGLYEAVCQAYATGSFEAMTWGYEETPIDALNLDAYYESLCSEPQDAYYDAETHTIVEAQPGFGFDLEEGRQKLAAAAAGSEVTLQLSDIEPALTKEQLTGQMFGTKLESRSSVYVNNANRTENLRLACEFINGTIINQGEVFSFNDAVGQRTSERGFKPATIYADGGASVEDTGGGVCQVASTIYYTTLYMNLEQVMREPHMYQVTYVPAGMDATVYWDSGLDYKFKNTLSNPIKIQANIEGGKVNITFWGVKENDNYVEMTSKVLSTFSEPDKEVVDETKPVGYRERTQTAYTGAKVEAYQKVFDSSGNLLEERTIYSTYKSRPNIYTVGPAAPVEEPPEPDPYPDPYPDPDPIDPDDPLNPPDPGEYWP